MKKFNKDKYLRKLRLRSFYRKYGKYFYIGITCLLVAVLGIYFAFSKFTATSDTEVIRTTVGDFIYGDVVIGSYINGEYSKTVPSKNDGYIVDKIVCDNNAIGKWDYDEWGLLTKNVTQKTKCNIYFKEGLSGIIINLANNDSIKFIKDDSDNNIRYIGFSPNNYVYFNCSDYSNQSDNTCEKWRIIGLFNNISKSNNYKDNLIKIIKDDSIGSYAWNDSEINDWTMSTLQQYLNSGTYYTKVLKNDTTRNAIENVIWNLGGTTAYNTATTSEFYTFERGNTVYSGRPTKWTGKIGLMYPSDYGYATSGGITTNRTTCLAKELYNWNSLSDCYSNDYLYKSGYNQWTLMPYSNNAAGIFNVFSTGSLDNNIPTSTRGVRPTLYLKSNISIKSGNGSTNSPYQLEIG